MIQPVSLGIFHAIGMSTLVISMMFGLVRLVPTENYSTTPIPMVLRLMFHEQTASFGHEKSCTNFLRHPMVNNCSGTLDGWWNTMFFTLKRWEDDPDFRRVAIAQAREVMMNALSGDCQPGPYGSEPEISYVGRHSSKNCCMYIVNKHWWRTGWPKDLLNEFLKNIHIYIYTHK